MTESAVYDEETESTEPYQEVQESTPTPLPKLQLFLVILVQFAEPVTSTVIFPFIPQLIRISGITHGDEKSIGYYAGMIESIFYFGEFSTVLQWGRAADRVGRRPILLLGMLGLTCAMIGFGVSTTFWAIVVCRMAQGVFNGNIGVTKTVMAEITDSSNIARAYSFVPAMFVSGSVLGPFIGGIFSRPADRWPDTLGKFAFLREYPFFLPCAIAGIVPLLAYVMAFLGLKETLPSALQRERERQKRQASVTNPDITSDTTSLLVGNNDSLDYGTETSDSEPSVEVPATLRQLLTGPLMIVYLNQGFLAFYDLCYQVLLPLIYSTSIPFGGLGLTTFEIGMIMGTCGIFNGLFQLFALPILSKRFGWRNLYIVAYAALAVTVGAYPTMSFFAKSAGRVDWRVKAVIVVQLFSYCVACIGWTCTSIFTIQATPRSSLSAANALLQMTNTFTRSFAPTITSSLFSLSLERNLLGGNLVYIILLFFHAIGVHTSFMLPKSPPPRLA